MLKRNNLFVPDKLEYAKGERPPVECILCAVAQKSEDVVSLEIARYQGFVVSANLYPYNPGHMLIFPERHIEHPNRLQSQEVVALHHLQMLVMDVLETLYGAESFNSGYNVGASSGASIDHFHVHVVPRYDKESGFIDIIGGAKIIVEDPQVTCRRFREVLIPAVEELERS